MFWFVYNIELHNKFDRLTGSRAKSGWLGWTLGEVLGSDGKDASNDVAFEDGDGDVAVIMLLKK